MHLTKYSTEVSTLPVRIVIQNLHIHAKNNHNPNASVMSPNDVCKIHCFAPRPVTGNIGH